MQWSASENPRTNDDVHERVRRSRRPTRRRRRITAVACSALLAAVGAGCGGADTVASSDWAAEFCDVSIEFGRSADASTDLAPDRVVDDVDAAREFADDFVDRLADYAEDLAEIPPPAVEGGPAWWATYTRTLRDDIDGFDAAVATMLDEAEMLDPSGPVSEAEIDLNRRWERNLGAVFARVSDVWEDRPAQLDEQLRAACGLEA